MFEARPCALKCVSVRSFRQYSGGNTLVSQLGLLVSVARVILTLKVGFTAMEL